MNCVFLDGIETLRIILPLLILVILLLIFLKIILDFYYYFRIINKNIYRIEGKI